MMAELPKVDPFGMLGFFFFKVDLAIIKEGLIVWSDCEILIVRW
jgi:hypothetical protein